MSIPRVSFCGIIGSMSMLPFKQRFRAAILDGSKTTTLRAWSRQRLAPGQIVTTNLGIRLRIESVELVALSLLTDEHARSDGFVNRAALLSELRAIYQTLPPVLTLIRFSLVD